MRGSHEILAFFVVVVLVTRYAVLWVVRSATPRKLQTVSLATGAWLAVTALLAWRGMLAFGPMPPPVSLLLAVAVGLTCWSAFSAFGGAVAHLAPLHWLVGFQAFRILVEVFLHWGYGEGLVPKQLTWESCNWDVITGLTAIPVAWLAARGTIGRRGVLVWNCLGLALLVNVVTVAILSMPTPLRLFTNGPANRFVTTVPYVWLPAFLVQVALWGHLLVFRRLWRE
jgi:hypothetical protein